MKNLLSALLTCLLLVLSTSARGDVGDYWINVVMTSNDAKTALGDSVLFFFGDEPHGKILRKMRDVSTRRKTNALNKSEEEACHRVFLSAMKELKAQALKSGGNAVVNIRSNYRGDVTSSNETFKCGSGLIFARVGLIGTVVEMER